MKPKLSIYILIVVGLICLGLAIKGKPGSQDLIDAYGPKPTKDERTDVVKLHVALELMNGTFTPEQKEILLRVIADPKSVDESAASLFTTEQAKRIFYAIGTVDIRQFKTIYKMDVLADKKLLYLSLPPSERAHIWPDWFAYKTVTKNLNRDQIEDLLTASDLLRQWAAARDAGNQTAEAAIKNTISATLDANVPAHFSKDLAREIFGSIGPFRDVGVFCKKEGSGPSASTAAAPGECVCSIDHSNFSCDDSCAGGSGCRETDGGCSWLYLFNCTGSCSISQEV
jgi:hypothetical protein